MAGDRDINTQGGGYEETNNSGQSAGRDINNFGVAAPALERTAAGTPHNLQARGIRQAGRFVGRDRELARLDELLARSGPVAISSAPRLAGLVGMGGVGKTELAVQYARRCLAAEAYPGGVVWLSGARAALDLVSFAQGALFRERWPTELRDMAAQVQFVWDCWPGDGAVLVVVDDVADFAAEVEPWLPGGDRFRVLVTTRRRLTQLERLDLEVLKPLAATRLLVSWVGRDRVCQEARTARDLLGWLGWLPKAIELVGGLLATERYLTVAALFEQLKAERLRHEAIERIDAVFEVSWGRLSESAQQLAAGLSVFADAPIPWELVAGTIAGCRVEPGRERKRDKLWRKLTGQPRPVVKQWCLVLAEPDRRKARRELEELHLLERVGKERYGLHPLVREFFAEKLSACDEATDWRRAFASALLRASEAISQSMNLTEVAQFEPSLPHLIELAAQFDSGEFAEKSARACGALFVFYYAQGLFDRAQHWSERALEIYERQLGSDHPHTASSLNNLAGLHYDRGQYAEALPLYQRALEILRKALGEQHPHTQSVLKSIAIVSEKLSDPPP